MRYKPMLAQTGTEADLKSKQFLFQPKLDGTRFILYKQGRKIELINRRGNNITTRYPEVKAIISNIRARSAVLDGELIIYRNGVPDFSLLQGREHITSQLKIALRAEQYPATLVVFDILEKDGKSLLNEALEKRFSILKSVIKENNNLQLIFSTDNGAKLWKLVKKLKLEGIVAKRKGSRYTPGIRSSNWLKIKNIKTIDAVIVGYVSKIRKIASLALAAYEDKNLLYIGNVGTGFTETFLDDLYKQLHGLEAKHCPVVNPPSLNIHWVKPVLIAEVEYLELTKHKELRTPSFKRLREDKPVKQCALVD